LYEKSCFLVTFRAKPDGNKNNVPDECESDIDFDEIIDEEEIALNGNIYANNEWITKYNFTFDDGMVINLTYKYKDRRKVQMKDIETGKIKLEFYHNFSNSDLQIYDFEFIENLTDDDKSYTIIKGIYLDANETKSIRVKQENELTNSICIKDDEITSIEDISDECTGTNEFVVNCTGIEVNGFNCTIEEDGYYYIQGLKNSGVIEIEEEGDEEEEEEEPCTDCDTDTGTTRSPSSPSTTNPEETNIDLTKESIFSIENGDKLLFEIENEAHSIEASKISTNYVELIIASTPVTKIIYEGQSVSLDLDNNFKKDLYIKLSSISFGKAYLEIKNLEEEEIEDLEQVIPTPFDDSNDEEPEEGVIESSNSVENNDINETIENEIEEEKERKNHNYLIFFGSFFVLVGGSSFFVLRHNKKRKERLKFLEEQKFTKEEKNVFNIFKREKVLEENDILEILVKKNWEQKRINEFMKKLKICVHPMNDKEWELYDWMIERFKEGWDKKKVIEVCKKTNWNERKVLMIINMINSL
jgi:hypothetical protein